MLDFIKSLFKGENYKGMMAKGAVIIDVRSDAEYKNGHISGSKNIPLHRISSQSKELLALNKTIILCCASGMRSGQGTAMLKSIGVDAFNGGSWKSLQSKI